MSIPSPAPEALRAELLADPTLFAQKLDPIRDAVLLVRMRREDYRAASFLDDRILTPQTRGIWVRASDLDAMVAGAAQRPLHFVFHAGHVGSTLVSRLLEDAGGVLALREPLTLRTLAEIQDALGGADALFSADQLDTLTRTQLALWRRFYADTRAVIVKATSSAGRIAPRLLALAPDARALYLNLAPETYLATLLAGENSTIDLRGFAAERVRRLEKRAAPPPAPLYAMSLGELAAMTWAVERLTQAHAVAETGARILSMDFEALLRDPSGGLRRICAHFGLDASEDYFAAAPQSEALRRYAKAPEHAYSPQLRAEILQDSRTRNSAEIRQGMRWLEAFAHRSAHAARVFSG